MGITKGRKKKSTQTRKKDCESKSANVYNQFEKEYEKSDAYKKKKNLGINTELMQLATLHKTPKGITAQNDYFTFINALKIFNIVKNIKFQFFIR